MVYAQVDMMDLRYKSVNFGREKDLFGALGGRADVWRPAQHHIRIPNRLHLGSNRLFELHDLYWRAPESFDMWYKSRPLKRTI